MKGLFLTITLLAAGCCMSGQTWTRNCITETLYGDSAASARRAIVKRTYYDGLGRKRQRAVSYAGDPGNGVA